MVLLAVFKDRPDLADRHLETGCQFRAIKSNMLPCMELTS
jgi:hypothetical protein